MDMKAYSRPIIFGASVLPTDDDTTIVFQASQNTFGSEFTINQDVWVDYAHVFEYFILEGDDALLAALTAMDGIDGSTPDTNITMTEFLKYLDEYGDPTA